jgi:hypothetical protein
MKAYHRFAFAFPCLLFIVAVSAASFGQDTPNQPLVINLETKNPGFVRIPKINVNDVQQPSPSIRLALPQNTNSTRGVVVLKDANSTASASSFHGSSVSSAGPNINGLNTVPTFTGAFASNFPAVDPFLNGVFPFIMIGNQPELGGTTVIPAKMTAVSLQLLNGDGTVFANVPFTFEDLTEDSPNFRDSNFSVGRTQFGDAVQRAEFFNMMKENWHTLLNPSFVNRATLQIPKTVQVQFGDGTVLTVPGYITTTAADGSTVVFMLDLLFNFLDTNQAVTDINAGNFTTNAMNYHVYPNTFLFSLVDEQGDTVCCTLGFHTFFLDPTVTPQPRWIYSFASWISPGIFGAGFQDVTGFSHETSEALNDPFGNNIVPTWQFPGIPGACQSNLETGDPVEVLPNATVPIVTREGHEVFQYHPQTEALLQWFEIGNPSNAIGGAFSFPNTAALPVQAVPCPF